MSILSDEKFTKNIEPCPDELVNIRLLIENYEYILINNFKSEAGLAHVCNGCTGQKNCKESFNMIDTDIEDIKVRMNVIKNKILIMSGKGGEN
jgi:hypothetical protein